MWVWRVSLTHTPWRRRFFLPTSWKQSSSIFPWGSPNPAVIQSPSVAYGKDAFLQGFGLSGHLQSHIHSPSSGRLQNDSVPLFPAGIRWRFKRRVAPKDWHIFNLSSVPPMTMTWEAPKESAKATAKIPGGPPLDQGHRLPPSGIDPSHGRSWPREQDAGTRAAKSIFFSIRKKSDR